MKTTLLRLGRTAACLVLAGALLASCSLLPAASPRKDPAPAEQRLYDTTALEDGHLRILYGSQGSAVLCGGTVLHQSRPDENISLLPDTLTGEAHAYWVSQADNTLPSGRRSTLYDESGTPLFTFEREYAPTRTGNDLILGAMSYLDLGADHAIQPGECRVLDLRTGEDLPVPERAYQCAVVGDLFAFTCYDRPADLADGDYDEDLYQHTRVVIQDREGNVLREEAHCTAQGFSADSNSISTDWLMLDFYNGTDYLAQTSHLYNPATGEELEGFDQVCGNGTASFRNEDGSYRLVDLESDAQSEVLCTFDRSISYYVPGAAICWQSGSDFRYQFHDLTTGEVKSVYAVDTSNTQLAFYATDGTLRVYDRTTGDLCTDLTVEPLPGQDTAQIWTVGDDYVLLMLYPAGDHSEPDIRLYDSNGLVREIEVSPSTNGYVLFAPLTTADGHAYFRYGYDGPNNTTLFDVLDETGTVVVKGLSTCYSYYSTGINALPEGAFVARRGFHIGWMKPDGSWLYCQSIFTANTDEPDNDFI